MLSSYESICLKAHKTLQKAGVTDPFKICSELGIIVLFTPMGTFHGACKGFFLAQSRKLCININSDLSEELQRIICAHELGHAMLHRRSTGIKAFHEFTLFETASMLEYEANIFAAEILLQDSDVLDLLNRDLSFFQAASELYVPAEILDFKFRVMKWKGYKMIDPPMMANGNFLKDTEDGGTHDYFS